MASKNIGYGGWICDLPDHRDLPYFPSNELLQKLPSRIDLSEQCPPVYDQGSLRSCTANAIAAAIEFERKKQNLSSLMPSRLFIYYNEREIEGTVNIDNGAQIRHGIKSVAKQGWCPEGEWPYDITKFAVKPPPACYQNAIKEKVIKYSRLKHDLNHMKSSLASGQPFVFGLVIYESFLTLEVARTGIVPVPEKSEKPHGGHAMLAVGYDDSQQSFIARSSSSSKWGIKGYCMMPYSYLTNSNLADDFWQIKLVSE
jgi:C1A family cysteine protease